LNVKSKNNEGILSYLCSSSLENEEQILKILISKGVDLNSKNSNAVLRAIYERKYNILPILIKNECKCIDFNGNVISPLQIALTLDDSNLFSFLLRNIPLSQLLDTKLHGYNIFHL
jgi:ankyrin repeat protein